MLRRMRAHRLRAPHRALRPLGPRHHDGTIIPQAPDRMWGATSPPTREEGQVTVFVVVDHFTHEGLGIHAAKIGNRFKALEPLRQAIRLAFREFREGVAAGLKLRHDHGSQCMRDDHPLGAALARHRVEPGLRACPPKGNGCAERFLRTLKEQLLWVRAFRPVEERRQALHAWLKTYNEPWLAKRHGPRARRPPCGASGWR